MNRWMDRLFHVINGRFHWKLLSVCVDDGLDRVFRMEEHIGSYPPLLGILSVLK